MNLLSDRLPIAVKVAAHGVVLFDVVYPGEEVEQGLEENGQNIDYLLPYKMKAGTGIIIGSS